MISCWILFVLIIMYIAWLVRVQLLLFGIIFISSGNFMSRLSLNNFFKNLQKQYAFVFNICVQNFFLEKNLNYFYVNRLLIKKRIRVSN